MDEQALEVFQGPVCATHSNRHLSDAMIRAIGARGGVTGTGFFSITPGSAACSGLN